MRVTTAETPVKHLANMSFEGGEKPIANAAISIMGLRRKGINAFSDGAKHSDSTGRVKVASKPKMCPAFSYFRT